MHITANRVSFDPETDTRLEGVDMLFPAALAQIKAATKQKRLKLDMLYQEEAEMVEAGAHTEASIPFGATCEVVALQEDLQNLQSMQQTITRLGQLGTPAIETL